MTADLRAVTSLAQLVDLERLGRAGVDLDAVALTDGAETLTWVEYADRVERLASVLRREGVAIGDRVAVRLAKSVGSFVAVHAIVRIGAVMVPVDPFTPAAATIIDDAGARVLVADGRARTVVGIVDESGIDVVVLPDAHAVDDALTGTTVRTATDLARADPVPLDDIDPDRPAYIIYTSGSTGRPKGIVHTHRSALAYAATAAEVYELRPTDRLANVAPLHFDQSTFELYAAPLAGAAVIVIPDPVLRFPASVAELIESERATVWYSVPHLLVQLTTRGGLGAPDLSSLRCVLFGGESFPPTQLAELMALLPDAEFANVYGPAEVNQCTDYRVRTPPRGPDAVPIGRAWPSAQLRVVDAGGDGAVDPTAEVEAGVPGLLLVTSATMMRGYWGRDDLTSQAIVTEVAGRDDDVAGDVTWYVTGDLVMERPDGDLVFLGRADNQVKVRGHRIELEAIDAVLTAVDGVAAATTVVDRRGGDDRLVALAVAATTADGETVRTAIRNETRARLPRYAVPGEVLVVDALPRTGTGKIDRGAAAALLEP